MSVSNFVRMAGMVVLTMATMAFFSGCEGGGDDNSGGGGNVVGTWAFYDAESGSTSWWAFNADGTVIMYDDAALSSEHLRGTFAQDGNKVTASFTNPGVGDGELACTLSDDSKTMQVDFIEHWHDPYKHVPKSGTRL